MDEVSGQVYPIGGGPDPADDYQLMYQGNYTTGSTGSTTVTLITKPITVPANGMITISVDDGYQLHSLCAHGNGATQAYAASGSNTLLIYAKNMSSDYEYKTNEWVINDSSANTIFIMNKRLNDGWFDTDLTLANSRSADVYLLGAPFLINKTDGTDITPEEAVQHVTIEVS